MRLHDVRCRRKAAQIEFRLLSFFAVAAQAVRSQKRADGPREFAGQSFVLIIGCGGDQHRMTEDGNNRNPQ